MPKKRCKSEEIVAKLRQVDVHLSQGSSVADAIRQIGAGNLVGEPFLPRTSAASCVLRFAGSEGDMTGLIGSGKKRGV